ncbi:hypothetical protein RhiirA5_362989 [Rhizophagus irregularis]|uniref:Uncharacterized protein n=1 Tax=Rhizophagus irregularis TaxID=588596 RepID=A0A2N0R8W5_9GLOM|nr:hypothetical protein RhiirA5_362989 [Rhizophagus irregularis]PKC59762.1 hypothetical protein RhiirA1_426629 [Rhizophagus irregularis]
MDLHCSILNFYEAYDILFVIYHNALYEFLTSINIGYMLYILYILISPKFYYKD